jgi:hypothetical protein
VRTAWSRGGGGEGGAEGDTYGMARASGGGRVRVNTGRDVRGAERTCCGAEQKADAEEVVWLDLAGAGRRRGGGGGGALARRTWLQGTWRRDERGKKGSGGRGAGGATSTIE